MRQCAAQVSLFDLRGAGGQPLFEQPGAIGSEPLSTRELVDSLRRDADPRAPKGTQTSGQQRSRMQTELDGALWQAYLHAWALTGTEEEAAAILLHMCARDRTFEPPDWLLAVWGARRTRLEEIFHGHGDDQCNDWSEGEEGAGQ